MVRLVGECRDLGDDRLAWRGRLTEGIAKMIDADLVFSGEVAGCVALRPRGLGSVEWGWENGFDREFFGRQTAIMLEDPGYYPTMNLYFARFASDDGVCLSRRQLLKDRAWYASDDYQRVHRGLGIDHMLWCFSELKRSAASDVSAGVVVNRARGRRDFKARERLLVRETHAAVARHIGGALAGHEDVSARALPPRARQVLACLLQGDTDKQVAARLRLSVLTVNSYTKAVYRHFGVRGRAELMARWIRRGWGAGFSWDEEP
ncbi:helix-turn-helix transcriptional regulator [Paludisphaera soli]|uniref:helix-turn-helix transcriptional regulator n=1 Tax=Paludisphaera soli TaxID=2712865 RepID=UPI0013EB1170|nr:helix-turn-helix transcriptional regulator [Paludisphaera soli]